MKVVFFRASTCRDRRLCARLFRIAPALAATAVFAAASGFAWPQPGINVSQLTHNGKSGSGVALSADGKQLAYVVEDDGGGSLWLHDFSSGPDRRLAGFQRRVQMPVFSLDAKSLWYLVEARPGMNNLERRSIADEDPKPKAEDVDTAVSFSPDGKSLAFIRWVPAGMARLVLLPTGSGKPQELLTLHGRPPAVAWSPDGTEVAVPVREKGYNKVQFVSVKKGTTREILSPGSIGALAWTKAALFATMRKSDQPSAYQVWSCSLPGGAWKQITHDEGGYVRSSLSASADGSLVAAARLVKFQTGLEDLAAWVGNKDSGPRVNPDVVVIRPGK
jgi:Tol biopolymer transport system component